MFSKKLKVNYFWELFIFLGVLSSNCFNLKQRGVQVGEGSFKRKNKMQIHGG